MPDPFDSEQTANSWESESPVWRPEAESKVIHQDVNQRIADSIRKRIKELGYQPEPHEIEFLKQHPTTN